MVEVKIIAVNLRTNEVYTDYSIFSSFEKATAWGDAANKENPGSVLDVVDEIDWNHTEDKYEYK